MTDSDVIRTRTEGHIFEVTLDRPKANAIDLVTSQRMGATFKSFRDDPDLRPGIRWSAIMALAALPGCRNYVI